MPACSSVSRAREIHRLNAKSLLFLGVPFPSPRRFSPLGRPSSFCWAQRFPYSRVSAGWSTRRVMRYFVYLHRGVRLVGARSFMTGVLAPPRSGVARARCSLATNEVRLARSASYPTEREPSGTYRLTYLCVGISALQLKFSALSCVALRYLRRTLCPWPTPPGPIFVLLGTMLHNRCYNPSIPLYCVTQAVSMRAAACLSSIT